MKYQTQELASEMSYPLGNALVKLVEGSEKPGLGGVEALEEAIHGIKLEIKTRNNKKKDKIATAKKVASQPVERVAKEAPRAKGQKVTKAKAEKAVKVVKEVLKATTALDEEIEEDLEGLFEGNETGSDDKSLENNDLM